MAGTALAVPGRGRPASRPAARARLGPPGRGPALDPRRPRRLLARPGRAGPRSARRGARVLGLHASGLLAAAHPAAAAPAVPRRAAAAGAAVADGVPGEPRGHRAAPRGPAPGPVPDRLRRGRDRPRSRWPGRTSTPRRSRAARRVLGGALLPSALAVAGLSLLVPFASLVRRYRHGGPADRQQLRWLVWAGLVALLVMLSSLVLPDEWASAGLLVAVTLAGAAVGVGIVRPTLVDVDALLGGTVVYALLGTALLLADLAVLAGTGLLLGDRVGERQAALLALALVTAVYLPLRDVLWRGVRRLVVGGRDDPYRVVSSLAEELERSAGPQEELEAVARAVARAFRAPYVRVEVDQPDGSQARRRHRHRAGGGPGPARGVPRAGDRPARAARPRRGRRAAVGPRPAAARRPRPADRRGGPGDPPGRGAPGGARAARRGPGGGASPAAAGPPRRARARPRGRRPAGRHGAQPRGRRGRRGRRRAAPRRARRRVRRPRPTSAASSTTCDPRRWTTSACSARCSSRRPGCPAPRGRPSSGSGVRRRPLPAARRRRGGRLPDRVRGPAQRRPARRRPACTLVLARRQARRRPAGDPGHRRRHRHRARRPRRRGPAVAARARRRAGRAVHVTCPPARRHRGPGVAPPARGAARGRTRPRPRRRPRGLVQA